MKKTPPKQSSTQNAGGGKRTGLARVLSKMGYCSRTEGAALVQAGRVTLNGDVYLDPETPVHMGQDRVAVDGKPVRAAKKVYWMLHKPAGLVTTADDERGRKTVYALLPAGLPWMGPVGRLDMESEGLLLMTNDTEWAARITEPESHLEKIYHAQLGRAPDAALLKRFEEGIEDEGEMLKAKRARLLKDKDESGWIEIVLEEGRNRHIRRMVEACNIELLRLVRVAIGGLLLEGLPKGEARELTARELEIFSR